MGAPAEWWLKMKNASSLQLPSDALPATQKLFDAYENRDYSQLTLLDILNLVKHRLIHPNTAARLAEEVKSVN